jgi:two-component system, response regulator YesN
MKIKSRLQTWYLVTIIFILFSVIALSFSISLQVDKLFIDYKDSVDNNGLEQAKETFSFLDATAQDIVLKVHSHPATILLSLAPSIDKVSPIFIRSFQRMQDMVLPFIYSINVIHIPTGRIITTNQGWYQKSGNLIQDLETVYPNLPNLTALPLKTVISYENKKELVFAYLARDTMIEGEGLTQGVILLVDSSWFLSGLAHADDERTGTKFHLYHSRLGILGEKSTNQEMSDLSENLKYQIQNNPDSGSFTFKIEATKYVIDYQILGDSELYLLRLRDETILQKEILLLRLKISGIAMVFLILVISGGLMLNKQVYRPFFSIVAEIRESMGRYLTIPENDLDLLNVLYGTLRDEYSDSGEDRIINSCLRSLSQEEVEKPEEIIEILNKRGINISVEKPGSLCLISIDDMDEEFTTQIPDTLSSYPALKFQFRNGTARALSELGLGSTTIFLRRGVMLLLLYSSEENIYPNNKTASVLHGMISDFMDMSISIVQSALLTDLSSLRQNYLTLSAALRRRYLFGKGIYLLGNDEQRVPDNIERKKIKELRSAVVTAISDQKILPEDLKTYLEILRTWVVAAAQDEINAFSLSLTRALSNSDADFQTQDLFKNLINQPTLDDFHTIVEAFSKENEGTFNLTESRHSALINLARDMIEGNYSDPGLSMTSIAEELKMSPTYFGMIFKKAVGTPFSDYLTMVRIQEAARLLKTSRDSVQEIMYSVGIPSESTFYRRFREIFNLTPQLFRQQSVLNNMENKKNKNQV